MTNGSSQGLFVIIALVIFGLFVFISYLLFRDTMKPALAKIYCDAFTITSKNTGFGKLGNCGVDSDNQNDKVQGTYYKIREETPEEGWSEVWVLVKELDNGNVEIIDSGNKDQFDEGDLGDTLIGDISFPDTVGDGLIIENIGKSAFKNAKFDNVMKLPSELIILDDYSLQQSHFSGEAKFPERLEIIGIEALRDSRFIGKLPEMPNMKEIGDNAFQDSIFEGNLPNLSNVNFVGKDAFKNSQFTGTFNGIGSGSGSDNGGGSGSGYGGESGSGSGGSSHGYSSNGGVVIADGAFENSNFTGVANIPSNVSIIGDNAFRNSNFTEIDLKDNTELVVIGDNAFENSNLTGVLYIPDSVKYIGDRAFYNSFNNNWDTKPPWMYDGYLEQYNFRNRLVLGKSLEYIGDFAFYNARFGGDFDMRMSPNLYYIGNSSFYNSFKQGYRNIVYGKVLRGNNANLYMNNKIETIDDYAFYNARFTLKEIFPNSLKKIGAYSFSDSFETTNYSHKYSPIYDSIQLYPTTLYEDTSFNKGVKISIIK